MLARLEKFKLFNDHNGSLPRRQPGALMLAVATVQRLGCGENFCRVSCALCCNHDWASEAADNL